MEHKARRATLGRREGRAFKGYKELLGSRATLGRREGKAIWGTRAYEESRGTRERLEQWGLRAHVETLGKKDLLDHKEKLDRMALKESRAALGPPAPPEAPAALA
jgi:hypothetical protein